LEGSEVALRNAQLTRAGYERLKEELAAMKQKRVTTIDEVKTAREYGDLKENGEYHAAREAYGWLEARIRDLEAKLDGAVVLEGEAGADEVSLGVPVVVRNDESGEVFHYTIVDAAEMDYVDNGISMESPLGECLLGYRVGEVADVETPRGYVPYTILSVGD
jgi:transcription elongation factor GreA